MEGWCRSLSNTTFWRVEKWKTIGICNVVGKPQNSGRKSCKRSVISFGSNSFSKELLKYVTLRQYIQPNSGDWIPWKNSLEGVGKASPRIGDAYNRQG